MPCEAVTRCASGIPRLTASTASLALLAQQFVAWWTNSGSNGRRKSTTNSRTRPLPEKFPAESALAGGRASAAAPAPEEEC